MHVLKGIDMLIEAGEMVSIMGPSGSGKSTLLNILGILDNYDKGTYLLDNTLIKQLNEKKAAQYRNKFLGFVFQSFNLLSFKSAIDNVSLPLYYQKVGRKEREKRAEAMLERVGLLPWKEHLPNEMSGGQKQRVAIARALVTNPKVILADEPTGALDSVTSKEIMSLFHDVNGEGMTMIIVTHDPEVAKETQRIINLKDGLITKV
jgi:putative ABC transport system ATP-binding protein